VKFTCRPRCPRLQRRGIQDISSLSALANLRSLDLSGNQIADLSPLVANVSLGYGTGIAIEGNPIDCTAQAQNIATLRVARTIQDPKRGLRPTGFDRLDRLTGGLHHTLTILGGRPGMGKTALASAIAVNLARDGRGVYFASLETSQTEVLRRMACCEARIDILRAVRCELSHAEWFRLTDAYRQLGALPIFIDDTPAVRLVELWTKCRRAQLALSREGHPLARVVVDYVQLMADPQPGMEREEAVGKNARGLANMARELKVTVLGLVQLKRAVETRTDKRPQLSDLRESGEFEQAARTVLLVYRDAYCRKDAAAKKPRRSPHREAKQRARGRHCDSGFRGRAPQVLESCRRRGRRPTAQSTIPLKIVVTRYHSN